MFKKVLISRRSPAWMALHFSNETISVCKNNRGHKYLSWKLTFAGFFCLPEFRNKLRLFLSKIKIIPSWNAKLLGCLDATVILILLYLTQLKKRFSFSRKKYTPYFATETILDLQKNYKKILTIECPINYIISIIVERLNNHWIISKKGGLILVKGDVLCDCDVIHADNFVKEQKPC